MAASIKFPRLLPPAVYLVLPLPLPPFPGPHPASRFTGADLYALCSDAWMAALKRSIAGLKAGQGQGEQDGMGPGNSASSSDGTAGAGGEASGVAEAAAGEAGGPEPGVEVTQEDFLAAADSLQPSLSVEEVAKYERIRDQYQQQSGQQR